MGKPPETEAELSRRQVLAQSIEGLRPAIYNWLAFARAPTKMITPKVISSQAEIESIADDASSEHEFPPDKRTPPKIYPNQ